MRHLLLFALLIPALLHAQNDERYLAGAVPVVNNKVLFSTEINVPGLSKDEIYDKVLTWAQSRFNGEYSQVVYSDKAKGEIAVSGKEYIIFSSSALSLDRAYMSFVVKIECSNQKCLVQTTNIRYEYNVSYQKEPEKYTAEKWITDEFALNKNNKLNRISGKFRRKTVDFVDEIIQNVSSALASQPAAPITAANTVTVVQAPATPTPQPVVSTPQQEAAPVTPVTPKQEVTPLAGFVSLDINNVPQTILQMIAESSVQITLNKNEAPQETAVQWKGLGNMFGKAIASVSVDENAPVYNLITTNNIYTLLFVKKDNSTPWMIMDCRKQGETNEGSQKTIIGEVLQIWIK